MRNHLFPHCTFDEPIDLSAEELASASGRINILLKSNYLVGASRDSDSSIHSLFDIAEEIAGVERCAYILGGNDENGFQVVAVRGISYAGDPANFPFDPVRIARHFGKVVLLDGEQVEEFAGFCRRWESRSLVAYPLLKNGEFEGALVFGKKESHPFTKSQIRLLWFLALQAESMILQKEAVKTLSFYSFLDPLTHLYNRRFFDNQIEKEIFRSRRNGNPFSLLMLDLDGFKAYNDRFLHTAGDIALQELATILQDTVREVDTLARWGGDEFAVILVESHAYGAADLARRLIERIGKHMLPGIDNTRTERLSASIGVATFPVDSFEKQDLIQKADRALYLAKNQGGGKVCIYHEIGDLMTSRPSPADIPLQKIYSAARTVVDMDRFLEILLFTAMQGLSAGRGSIVLLEPGGNHTIRAAVGFNNGEDAFAPGTIIPPGEITSWVMNRKEPLVVSGPDDMPLQRKFKKNGYRTDTFLSIPLIHEGRLLGALHLTNRIDKKPFTKEDLAAFDPIAREIAAILRQGVDFRENVRGFSTSILSSLSSALELRFSFLSGHNRRVQNLVGRIGTGLGMKKEELSPFETAAGIHDIGLVGIPSRILWKKRKLTPQELESARKHPLLGAKLLEGIPGMGEIRRIVLEHQEFFDGSGYPYGLRGEEICLGARILSVAEYYDSITSERPHRGGLPPEEARQIIRNSMGKMFDPAVCQAFLEQKS